MSASPSEPTIEWGVQLAFGQIMACNSERHAEGLLTSTSIMLGPLEGRVVVKREVSPWTPR